MAKQRERVMVGTKAPSQADLASGLSADDRHRRQDTPGRPKSSSSRQQTAPQTAEEARQPVREARAQYAPQK